MCLVKIPYLGAPLKFVESSLLDRLKSSLCEFAVSQQRLSNRAQLENYHIVQQRSQKALPSFEKWSGCYKGFSSENQGFGVYSCFLLLFLCCHRYTEILICYSWKLSAVSFEGIRSVNIPIVWSIWNIFWYDNFRCEIPSSKKSIKMLKTCYLWVPGKFHVWFIT